MISFVRAPALAKQTQAISRETPTKKTSIKCDLSQVVQNSPAE
jgi:hypothetical protein